MQTYSCFIRDRRYTVPTLRLIDASDDEAARRQALRELAASREHLGIELHAHVRWKHLLILSRVGAL